MSTTAILTSTLSRTGSHRSRSWGTADLVEPTVERQSTWLGAHDAWFQGLYEDGLGLNLLLGARANGSPRPGNRFPM